MNERSGVRYGTVMATASRDDSAESVRMSWSVPFGLATPAAHAAILYRRYMYEFGATEEHLAMLAVQNRRNASTNPAAWYFERPLSREEYFASRLVASPLRVPDCCQESDGAVAIVVTSADRARDLPAPPAYVWGLSQGIGYRQSVQASLYRDEITILDETVVAGRELWRSAGVSPGDVDVAILYDHFSPAVLLQVEALGFCERGEAVGLLEGGAFEIEGRLPINPHGGLIGEAYIHGFNGVAEAVRQIRGTAANQVKEPETALATGGPLTGTSALLFGRAPASSSRLNR
jgi:acetyl-CoA acetyltransferase